MDKYTFKDSINALEGRVAIIEAKLEAFEGRVAIIEAKLEALDINPASLDQEEEENTEEDLEE